MGATHYLMSLILYETFHFLFVFLGVLENSIGTIGLLRKSTGAIAPIAPAMCP